jgi:hypothetical protein
MEYEKKIMMPSIIALLKQNELITLMLKEIEFNIIRQIPISREIR